MARQVTLFGETVWLIDARQNWARQRPQVTRRFKTAIERSETDRESRQWRWGVGRMEATWAHTLTDEEMAAVRTMLATLGASRVAVPCSWDKRPAEEWDQRYFRAQAALDLTTGDLYEGADALTLPAGAAGHWVAPLIVGRLEERPQITARTLTGGHFALTLFEDSDFAARVEINTTAQEAGTFPDITPVARSLIDFSLDGLEYEEAGEGREKAVAGGLRAARWGMDLTFLLEGPALRDLLTHYERNRGRYGAFVIPAAFRPHGANATDETPDAYMARYARDELTIDFRNRDVAEVKVRVLQLPWELNLPAGEEPTEAPEAHLYQIAYEVPVGGPVHYRYTDYEQALTLAGNTYAPARMEHSEVTEGDTWGSDSLTLEGKWFGGNPLGRIYRREQEAPMRLTVWRCDPSDPDGTAEEAFDGLLGEPKRTKTGYQVKVQRHGVTQVPRIALTRLDTRVPYSDNSPLEKDTWKRTAVVAEVWPDGKVLCNFDDGGGVPAANWFCLVARGSGEDYECRDVLAHYSQADPGAEASIDPSHPFRGATVGEQITLYPGFDGTWEQWQARFPALAAEFRGFPHLPLAKPNLSSDTGIVGKGGGK